MNEDNSTSGADHDTHEIEIPGPEVVLYSGAATHVGAVREHNEDSYLSNLGVYVVSDGMGGHAGGELASAAIVKEFRHLKTLDIITHDDVQNAVHASGQAIVDIAEGGHGRSCPGATVTGAALTTSEEGPDWLIFNIGDSRTYRMREGILEQVTVDHSEVQAMVDSGQFAEDDPRVQLWRHVITRAIGAGMPIIQDADIWLADVADGDRLLICSDGLNNELTDQEVHTILMREKDPQVAAETLVNDAVAAGGRDNVTVIVVDAEVHPPVIESDIDATQDVND